MPYSELFARFALSATAELLVHLSAVIVSAQVTCNKIRLVQIAIYFPKNVAGAKVPQEREFSLWTFCSWKRKCSGIKIRHLELLMNRAACFFDSRCALAESDKHCDTVGYKIIKMYMQYRQYCKRPCVGILLFTTSPSAISFQELSLNLIPCFILRIPQIHF